MNSVVNAIVAKSLYDTNVNEVKNSSININDIEGVILSGDDSSYSFTQNMTVGSVYNYSYVSTFIIDVECSTEEKLYSLIILINHSDELNKYMSNINETIKQNIQKYIDEYLIIHYLEIINDTDSEMLKLFYSNYLQQTSKLTNEDFLIYLSNLDEVFDTSLLTNEDANKWNEFIRNEKYKYSIIDNCSDCLYRHKQDVYLKLVDNVSKLLPTVSFDISNDLLKDNISQLLTTINTSLSITTQNVINVDIANSDSVHLKINQVANNFSKFIENVKNSPILNDVSKTIEQGENKTKNMKLIVLITIILLIIVMLTFFVIILKIENIKLSSSGITNLK